MRALAEAWGAELWSYQHGHISVMRARGIGSRLRRWLISPHPPAAGVSAGATLQRAAGAVAL
jgi:hypothetical protein